MIVPAFTSPLLRASNDRVAQSTRQQSVLRRKRHDPGDDSAHAPRFPRAEGPQKKPIGIWIRGPSGPWAGANRAVLTGSPRVSAAVSSVWTQPCVSQLRCEASWACRGGSGPDGGHTTPGPRRPSSRLLARGATGQSFQGVPTPRRRWERGGLRVAGVLPLAGRRPRCSSMLLMASWSVM